MEMVVVFVKFQLIDGFWFMSLKVGDVYIMLEMFGMGFFIFGLVWGINNGYLDSVIYLFVVEKGWVNMILYIIDLGMLGYV